MNKKMDKIKFSILTFSLIFILLFFNNNDIQLYGFTTYLIQLSFIFYLLIRKNNNHVYLLSPSFLTILYSSLTFGFGHYVVSRNIGFKEIYYLKFIQYENLWFITSFFLISNLIVFNAIPFKSFKTFKTYHYSKNTFKTSPIKVLLFLFILLTLNILAEGFANLGDFIYPLKLTVVIFISFLLKGFVLPVRLSFYLIELFLIGLQHWDSKREILFVLIFIVFYEIIVNNINLRIKIKYLSSIIGVLCLAFYIIMVSSISRGYGEYNVGGDPVKASSHVLDFLSSDIAIDAFAANFELSYGYGHSSNAIDLVYKNPLNLLFGSTLIKFIFIPIPRGVWKEKPKSIVDIYTSIFDPAFRNMGGSYPISFYSELFWNFHLFGLFVLFLVFKILNRAYFLMINKISGKTSTYLVFLIFMYTTFIQFIRGSGIELWLIYGIISIPFAYMLVMLKKLTFKSRVY
jgi:hypothetical protein